MIKTIIFLCAALCLVGCKNEELPIEHPAKPEHKAYGQFQHVCIDGYEFITWACGSGGGITQVFENLSGSPYAKRCK